MANNWVDELGVGISQQTAADSGPQIIGLQNRRGGYKSGPVIASEALGLIQAGDVMLRSLLPRLSGPKPPPLSPLSQPAPGHPVPQDHYRHVRRGPARWSSRGCLQYPRYSLGTARSGQDRGNRRSRRGHRPWGRSPGEDHTKQQNTRGRCGAGQEKTQRPTIGACAYMSMLTRWPNGMSRQYHRANHSRG